MFLIYFIILYFVIYIYLRFTCGVCKCSRHLVGKVVIVTGGNKGIGYETAKSLAERGARVILGCRSEARGAAARHRLAAETGNPDVHYRPLDLASLASVRQFAQTIIATEKKIDILINNAGIYSVDNIKTEDGLSYIMQVNHFGPFLLTSLLLPLLKSSAPSRIINVSSVAHKYTNLDFDNLNMEKDKESFSFLRRGIAYANSKLCNVLTAAELQRRLRGTGVTAYSLHPGTIPTDMFQSVWRVLPHLLTLLMSPLLKSSFEGAQTSIYLAVTPNIEDLGGSYFSDCQQNDTDKIQDEESAKKLWEISEQLVKLK